MISIVETTPLAASPSRVWAFFTEMQAHYLDWHPEHLAWRDLKDKVTTPGGVIFADEGIGWLRLAGRFVIDEARAPSYLRFRIGFPYSLVRAGGWFRIDPTVDGSCAVTAESHLGYRTPLIGRLLDLAFHAWLPLDELRRHMHEEGENLARLVRTEGEDS